LTPAKQEVEAIRDRMCMSHIRAETQSNVRKTFFSLLAHFNGYSCLPQSFHVRMPSFLPHSWIPVLWWMYEASFGVFFLLSAWSCANTYSVISYGQQFFSTHALFTVPTIWTMCLQWIIIIIITVLMPLVSLLP